MTKLEFFESGIGLTAVKLGIVSIEWLVKYDVYKVYLDFVKSGSAPWEAKILAADKCKCDVTTVRRYIKRFESDEPIGEPIESGNRMTSSNSYWKNWPSQKANTCTPQ